ncbi:MFS transporter [Kutzneria sp. NPDC052558]|uniref:MFS transporter n=1 Tax=Kutzneria sp. NPDC052558 TaxID=3364121 RepID=UPI0037CC2AC1
MPSYRCLLRTPGAAAFFFSAALGRVGIAMTSLGLVWLVHSRTDSYTTAGLVTAGFAIAEAVAGPQLARLTDRFGQTRVLPFGVLAHALAIATLVTLVAFRAPDWLLTSAGVLAGGTIPQLGALSAARWTFLLRDSLPSAFALEALANELAFLAGPALVSLLGSLGHPYAGALSAVTLVILGGLVFAAQRRTAPPPSSPRLAGQRRISAARSSPSLLRPSFALLAGVNLALGGFFGSMPLALTAFVPAHSSALLLVSSAASLLAGWLYGLRRWRWSPGVQLAFAAALLLLGSVPPLFALSPSALAFSVPITGFAVPLIIVLSSVLTSATVPRAVLTQAFVWLGSASAAGSAAASALTGWAVDAWGPTAGFPVATLSALLLVCLAGLGLRPTSPPTGPPAPRSRPTPDR